MYRVGERIGDYEILQFLGAGGMGQVYKVRNRLSDRIEAMKVLLPDLMNDPQLADRFLREIKVQATLVHKNIAQLYTARREGDQLLMLLEVVDGITLNELLQLGPLNLNSVVSLFSQVLDALSFAHSRGVVHRDIKPQNIMVTPDGTAKLMDFGIARVAQDQRLTQTGRALGSVYYMSPEQIRALEDIDGRSDLYSLGITLYEAVTGSRPFDGESDYSIMAAHLQTAPTPPILRDNQLTQALSDVVMTAIEKEREPRYQSAMAFKAALQSAAGPAAAAAAEAPQAESVPAAALSPGHAPSRLPDRPRATPPPNQPTFERERGAAGWWTPAAVRDLLRPPRRRIWLATAWIAAGGLSLVALAVWLKTPATPPRSVTRAAINLPGNTFVTPVVSRDGTRMLYSEVGIPPRLWLRRMDELEGHAIADTEGADWGTFSPDGQSIAFLKGPSPYKLAKISVNGGRPVILSSEPELLTIPSWSDDGSILAGSARGVVRVPAGGGPSETLTAVDHKNGEIGHYEPVQLPSGRGVLFSVVGGPSPESPQTSTSRVAVLDLNSRAYQVLPGTGSAPRYVPTGHLVYRRGATLLAVPFDAERLKVTGSETPVLQGLATSAAPYSFSPSGLLVYRSGTGSENSRESTTLAWMDRKGVVESLPEPPHQWQTISLSPDGRRVVGDLLEAGAGFGKERMWIYDITRGVLTRLTSGEGDHHPIWSPDGRSITFASNRGGKFGIFRVPVDSSTQPEVLLSTESISYPYSWTPDGKTLAYYQFEHDKGQIFLLPVSGAGGGDAKPSRFHPGATSSELQPLVSPDGKWLAYTSDQSGRFEIYVSSFPGSGGMFQVSTQGGRPFRWSPNGRELSYVEPNPRRLMVAEISPGPLFQAGRPQPLFTIRNDAGGRVSYDVSRDGKRFLVVMPPQGAGTAVSQSTFVIVTEWFEELRRLAPPKK